MIRTWVFEQAKDAPTTLVQDFHSGAGLGFGGDSPARMFAVIRFGSETTRMRSTGVKDTPFDIWFHDDPGSYLPIDAEIKVLQDHFKTVYPAILDDITIFDIVEEGISTDLVDEGYRTICKFASWRLRWRR